MKTPRREPLVYVLTATNFKAARDELSGICDFASRAGWRLEVFDSAMYGFHVEGPDILSRCDGVISHLDDPLRDLSLVGFPSPSCNSMGRTGFIRVPGASCHAIPPLWELSLRIIFSNSASRRTPISRKRRSLRHGAGRWGGSQRLRRVSPPPGKRSCRSFPPAKAATGCAKPR